MDQMRLLAALVLSFLVFMVWNVFFTPEPKQPPVPQLQQEARVEDKTKPTVTATNRAEWVSFWIGLGLAALGIAAKDATTGSKPK